jgi:hypothetical protein
VLFSASPFLDDVPPLGAVAPECAADAGSWCARVWSWTGLPWPARGADATISVLFSVIGIIAVAVLVRSPASG